MLDCREVRTDFNCEACYELTFESCSDMSVSGQLTPATVFYIQLFDQFDIRRTIQFISEADGSFEIDQDLLPDSYFNPFGSYDFYISTDEDGIIIAPLTFDAIEYNCVILNIEPAGEIIPDVPNPLIEAFLTATGITDETISEAIANLVESLEDAGILDKTLALYPMVGGTATTHKYNLMDARDEDDAFRLQFFGGWTHSGTGAKGNGTNSYANTFFIPSDNLPVDSQSYSYYCYNPALFEFGYLLGAKRQIPVQGQISIVPNYGGDKYNHINTPPVRENSVSLSGFHFVSSQPVLGGQQIVSSYLNGILSESNTMTPSGNTNNKIFINGDNFGSDVPSNYSASECRIVIIQQGLTDAEVLTTYNIVQNFQASLGRSL